MAAPLTRNCPVCAASASQLFVKKGELSLVRCAECSMVYANPVAAGMATGIFYNAAGDEYLAADKLGSDYAEVRFERELRLFRSHCSRGSVLDVGCSSGGFLWQLQRRHPDDYQILGTDVSEAPLAHAASMGVPVIRDDFLSHHFDQQFDAVMFWAVMEHLFAPEKFLKKAAEILKPGGWCFILVPNLNSLAIRLLGAKYRYIFSEHLNYFSPLTLKRFVNRELKVESVLATHFNPLVIWQDFRQGEREVSREERARLLKRTNAYKKSPWLWPVKVLYQASEAVLRRGLLADNLVIVARKR